MQKNLNKTATENNLNRIFGTDFKVRDFENGLKVNVPSIDVTQMGELNEMYQNNEAVSNVSAKRSGTGITVIVIINE